MPLELNQEGKDSISIRRDTPYKLSEWNSFAEALPELEINTKLNITEEQVKENLENALHSGFKFLKVVPAHERKFVALGSGPSVLQYLGDLRSMQEDDVDFFFTKSGHDFYVNEGIIHNANCVLLDGREVSASFFSPDHRIKYYIASQCHRNMFEKLEEYNPTAFHTQHKKEDFLKIARYGSGVSVLGGTTSITRMVGLGEALGYREFLFLGVDSSFSENRIHPYLASNPREKEPRAFIVTCMGRDFLCNPTMLMQIRDFISILAKKPKTTKITIAGEGLLPWVVDNISDGAYPRIVIKGRYNGPL